MTQRKPLIAVPIGDPAGVGPEIVAKACALEKVNDAADVIVIGDRQVMENAIGIVGAPLTVNVVEKPTAGDYRPGILNLIDLANIDQAEFAFGVVAMVAMTPLITIQCLGFKAVVSARHKRNIAFKRILATEEDPIIYFD